MALGIGDNFSYQGKKPNFERDTFATKAAMKAFPEANIDNGHISFCEEDGYHYVYRSDNPVDSVTGRWKADFANCNVLAITLDSLTGVMEAVIGSNTSFSKGEITEQGNLEITFNYA